MEGTIVFLVRVIVTNLGILSRQRCLSISLKIKVSQYLCPLSYKCNNLPTSKYTCTLL